MRKRDRQAILNRKPPNSRLAEKLSIQGRPSVVRIGLEGLQVYFWKGSEAGSGGRHSRVLPGFPVRRCRLCRRPPCDRRFSGRGAARATHFRRRLRLRSFLRRLCPVHRILKAMAERPTAISNPSEPRRRTRFSPQCSGLSIADSHGPAWTERRSANCRTGASRLLEPYEGYLADKLGSCPYEGCSGRSRKLGYEGSYAAVTAYLRAARPAAAAAY